MDGIIASNGQLITDEMINAWESALEQDTWPEGWTNHGEVLIARLPSCPTELDDQQQ